GADARATTPNAPPLPNAVTAARGTASEIHQVIVLIAASTLRRSRRRHIGASPGIRAGPAPERTSVPARIAPLASGAVEYWPLGGTGVMVSPLCLGAMMFGAWGNRDRDESVRIIHRALDAGINFIDTADVYSRGESEEIVGQALAGGRRDDVVLATKFHGSMGDDPNRRGNSRRWIMQEVENSLRRLGTDWIDLYQVHRYDEGTDLDETLGALSDL